MPVLSLMLTVGERTYSENRMIEVRLKVNVAARVSGIKVLRTILGLGLKDAKDLSDSIYRSEDGKLVRMSWEQFGRFSYEQHEAVAQSCRLPFYTSKHKIVEQSSVIDFTRYNAEVQA